MAEVESDSEAPAGFQAAKFAGIGMVASMLEPISISNTDDWKLLISELEPWGEVPDSDSITEAFSEPSERGMIATLSANGLWIAEFLPWGSDGRLRARARAAPKGSRVPSGGYTWADGDVILLWRAPDAGSDAASELKEALRVDDLSNAQGILCVVGEVLGRYHSAVEEVRTTPRDPSRWNARTQWLEETLRATHLWRAKYSKNQPCTLSLGDVRLSDISADSLRIGRPRLADALRTHTCEFPAMRDLASLVHDLSRIHHSSSTSLDQTSLRLALIDGWKSTAPDEWASDEAFYSHRGGMAIWEYEQCLLDVLEATSNQSGVPEPGDHAGLRQGLPEADVQQPHLGSSFDYDRVLRDRLPDQHLPPCLGGDPHSNRLPRSELLAVRGLQTYVPAPREAIHPSREMTPSL